MARRLPFSNIPKWTNKKAECGVFDEKVKRTRCRNAAVIDGLCRGHYAMSQGKPFHTPKKK